MVIITSYTMVDHSILFRKLQDNVAHGAFLEILSSYLHVCTQNVKLDIARSKCSVLVVETPRHDFGSGSVQVFVNDFLEPKLEFIVHAYADDTTLFLLNIDTNQLKKKLDKENLKNN